MPDVSEAVWENRFVIVKHDDDGPPYSQLGNNEYNKYNDIMILPLTELSLWAALLSLLSDKWYILKNVCMCMCVCMCVYTHFVDSQ